MSVFTHKSPKDYKAGNKQFDADVARIESVDFQVDQNSAAAMRQLAYWHQQYVELNQLIDDALEKAKSEGFNPQGHKSDTWRYEVGQSVLMRSGKDWNITKIVRLGVQPDTYVVQGRYVQFANIPWYDLKPARRPEPPQEGGADHD